MRRWLLAFVLVCAAVSRPVAQSSPAIDWSAIEQETLTHFQALVRMDTSDPPGGEKPAAEYLAAVLKKEGITVETFANEPNRPNVVARLTGSGRKRPILIMGHTDTVNIDPKKWTHPPFGAVRDGGYIYGRGTIDDKDNVVAALMVMLMLKRSNLPLDRDVIFLAEAGEEGAASVGVELMANQHFRAIDAEYCIAEGGNVTRQDGQVRFASVQTVEKVPNRIELIARGPAGHGSVPLMTNAVVGLSKAVAAVAEWQPPIDLNDTTAAHFSRLAAISPPEQARYYRDVLTGDAKAAAAADAWLREHEPRHASMLRTSISPNIINGGYRNNVIPSEARASLDVRMLPDENPTRFMEQLKRVVNDSSVEAVFTGGSRADAHWSPTGQPRSGAESSINSEAFKAIEAAVTKHYQTTTLPTMSTGATDMAFLRAKGIQCYGIGPALDVEDGPKGLGSHSDQERILESELHRFVRFNWDVIVNLARKP